MARGVCTGEYPQPERVTRDEGVKHDQHSYLYYSVCYLGSLSFSRSLSLSLSKCLSRCMHGVYSLRISYLRVAAVKARLLWDER